MKAIAKGLIVCAALAALMLTQGRGGAAFASTDSLQARIDAAAPFDVVTVEGGTYHERIVLQKPIELHGIGYPVIDAGGEGDVVTITGPSVSISGFEIRGSGRAVSQEAAAIKVYDAHEPTIRSNRIRDALYGIHVTGTHHATIAFNDIDQGAHIPQERRGHGIYLWRVEGASIHANTITNSADGIHLEFSNDNGMGLNTVTHSRYAIHFMSSDNNRVLENTFRGNLTGAVLMFSQDLLVKDNQFSNNRDGATGAGMLIKDVDNIFVEGNTLQRNKYGITVEGTPNSAGASATFIRNLLALNDTGIGLFPNAPITFVENALVENTVQVEAISGALASGLAHGAVTTDAGSGSPAGEHGGHEANAPSTSTGARNPAPVWTIDGRGNYWSDYNGYDAGGDGVGDAPYAPRPPFAGALSDHDTLRLFQFTIAQQAIDVAANMFPLYQYNAVIQDSGPLMQPPGPALQKDGALNGGLLVVSLLLLVLAGAVLQAFLDLDAARLFGDAVRRLPGLQGGS
ncbi:MAG TPA: NosD domain-containing protein [Dehalococcoidia bacterium]|nr:NosD domain-containing protein [Dehalococcoidia bacterium]